MPGRNYVGWAREAVIDEPLWPSAQPALVTELLPALSMDPAQGISKEFTHDGHGPVGFTAGDVVQIAPRFPIPLYLTYGGLEPIFAAALGLELKRAGATILPEQLAPGVYRHLFCCDPVLSAMVPWAVPDDGIHLIDLDSTAQRKVRRGTVAAYREFGVWEWLSVMIDQLSLSWSAEPPEQAYGTCGLDCLAYSGNLSSTVNTVSTMQQAMPCAEDVVLFRDGIIRLAPYSSTTPLDDGDKIVCTSANITLQNQLAVDFGDGLHPLEFERHGPPIVLGSLLKPRYEDNTRVAAWESNATWMLTMQFAGPYISGTAYRYQFSAYVPGLKFTQVEPSPLSLARSSEPIQWYATTPDVQPAGFPMIDRQSPLMIEVVSDRGNHALL